MGKVNQRASRHGVLAFTVTGAGWSMCAGRAWPVPGSWQKDAFGIPAALIPELLHSLGFGEKPPTPAHITARVKRLC